MAFAYLTDHEHGGVNVRLMTPKQFEHFAEAVREHFKWIEKNPRYHVRLDWIANAILEDFPA